MKGKRYTEVGTDIDEVKRLNANSGPTYNEIKEMIAQKYDGEIIDKAPSNPLKKNVEVDNSTNKNN